VTYQMNGDSVTIGIVGAGIMGRGIAQIAAEAGITVLLADARRQAVDEAKSFVEDMLRRKASKGKLTAEQAEAACARVQATDAGPDAGYAAFAACDVVIEAVAERMEIKHAVLAGLEAAVRDECIIASNTSSLSVTGFAAGAKLPQRVAGFHFFNPVPLMRIVEVIGGVRTDEAVVQALIALAGRLGHRPVRATDTPGFLVNHAGRAFGTEALRILGEGVAAEIDVDRVLVETAGFRMGPLALLDLTGLDVSHAVIESIYHQYYQEPRYRPSVITAQRQAAGLYGRKVGEGFYRYQDGKAVVPPEPAAPAFDGATAAPFWVSNAFPADAERLRSLLIDAGAVVEHGTRPSAQAVCLVTPYGHDATHCAVTESLDPARVVAVDMLFALKGRRTAMLTPCTSPAVRDQVHAVLAADGAAVTVIEDSPGFIAQRVVACVVNVGCEIAQQRVAAPDDINIAVELGLGYPMGSLRFGDVLGPQRIVEILRAISEQTGDPRYRPSLWLSRRAALGLPLTTVATPRR
jgi:3-hydroxybutyryl-CoA dehydrogenase